MATVSCSWISRARSHLLPLLSHQQSFHLAWYDDHAIGLTRLNAYAGIASAFIITDAFEAGLVISGLLPDLVGIPLVI
jgi:hypothetical protein